MNDSKEHIVLIASKLFLRKNFKEVTMKEIVTETGLSKGAFYHYFESKEQLFTEVLDYFFSHVMNHDYENYSRASLHQFYQDYCHGLRKLSTKYINKFEGEQNEEVFTMNYFTMIFDALKLYPEFKEKMIVGFEKELSIWIQVIAEARNNGEIRSVMTDNQIAQMFMYVSDGVGMHMMLRGTPVEEMIAPFLNLWDGFYAQIKA